MRTVFVALTGVLVLMVGAPTEVSTSPVAAAAAVVEGESGAVVTAKKKVEREANRIETAIIRHTNKRRAKHDLDPVRRLVCVDLYAERFARRLVRRDAFEHSNLHRLLDRCDRQYVSENLARFPIPTGEYAVTPNQMGKSMVRAWMNSPGHRANLLSAKPHRIGVGVRRTTDGTRWLAVQNFSN